MTVGMWIADAVVGWCGLAVALAVLLGGAIRRRDEQKPVERPTYGEIADAIESACDGAELQLRLHFRGLGGGRAEPYLVLARLLEQHGLIDADGVHTEENP